MQQLLTLHPVVPAMGGMFAVSLLDAIGLLPAETPGDLALFYGVFGACGGLIGYFVFRRFVR